MNYIKVRPMRESPWHAAVYRDGERGHLTRDAKFLGRLVLHAARHYVYLPGEDEADHWYAQLTQALIHLATGRPTESARSVVRARQGRVAAYGYEGEGGFHDMFLAMRDRSAERAAFSDNMSGH